MACLNSLALTLTSSVVSAVVECTRSCAAARQSAELLLSVCHSVCAALTQTGLLPGCHDRLWRMSFCDVRDLGHDMPCVIVFARCD